jgi:hypothetical protein
MNLRLSEESTRFRVSHRELERLRTEGTLKSETRFSTDVAISYEIVRSDEDRGAIMLEETRIQFRVPAMALDDLAAQGDARDALFELTVESGPASRLRVLLEVDAFSDEKREARSRR